MVKGSLFIHETNPGDLLDLPPDLDESDPYVFVRLETMTTSDFRTLMAPSDAAWADGPPVCFDVSTGGVLKQISPEGLNALHRVYSSSVDLSDMDGLAALTEEQRTDVEMLLAFVDENGPNDIYELTTS